MDCRLPHKFATSFLRLAANREPQLDVNFMARHGVIEEFNLGNKNSGSETANLDTSAFLNRSICDVHDWTAPLAQTGLGSSEADQVGKWMNHVLGTEFTKS